MSKKYYQIEPFLCYTQIYAYIYIINTLLYKTKKVKYHIIHTTFLNTDIFINIFLYKFYKFLLYNIILSFYDFLYNPPLIVAPV